jgi:Fur family ferric uptake transcriptional regulator
MTDSPQIAPLQFEDIDEVFAVLRDNGHRVTTPCRLVLEVLFAAQGPVSAQHIAQHTPMVESDPSSVYRNLERLEQLGVVRHVHLGHGPSLYMLVGAGEKEFLVCERCDRVTSIDPEQMDAVRSLIQRQFGYAARFTHCPILGLCPDCAAREGGG